MTDYDSLSRIEFLPELRDATLGRKADILQRLLETSAFAPDGLMYSMPVIAGPRELRPFTPDDVAGTAINGEGYWHDPPVAQGLRDEGFMMENSVYTAGLYLRAEIERYGVTGEEAALREARRAYDSLRLIYRLNAGAGNPGFFSKPYGHRATDWSSADQHLGTVAGLYSYYRIAGEETRAEIARMWVDLADFARARDYQLCVGDLGGWKFKDQLYAFHAVFVLINALALHVSGEARFREELARVDARGRWKTGTELDCWREWGVERTLINEQGIPAHFCLVAAEILFDIAPGVYGAEAAGRRAACERILADWWRFSLIGMDADYLFHYWKDINPRSGEWWPTGYRELQPLLPGDPDVFMKHTSDVCHGEITYRVAYNSLIAALGAPAVAPEARRWLGEIMTRTTGNRLRWMIDPDGRQLLPQERWMACMLSSESPYLYLMTYWRGRAHGLWE